MVEQQEFMETIRSVAEIMRVAETPMGEQEILSYFKEMELTREQERLVLEYLSRPQEDREHDGGKADEEGGGDELPFDSDAKGKVFQLYLDEVEALGGADEKREQALYRSLLAGDEDAVSGLSNCWLSKVVEMAKGYMSPKLNIEDLVQEGNMALFIALKELCGAGKCENVKAYLKAAVERGIMDYASEINGLKAAEEAMVAKISLVNEARKLLTEENGVSPGLEQLSDYTGMPVKELQDIFSFLEDREKACKK